MLVCLKKFAGYPLFGWSYAFGFGALLSLVGICGLSGCRGDTERKAPATQPAFAMPEVPFTATMPAQYPANIKGNSDPLDVVSVFLAAVAAEDDPTLLGLVSKERALQAMKRLVLVRDLRDGPDLHHAVAMTLESWKHKLSLFERGSLEPFSATEPDANKSVIVTVRGKDARTGARFLALVTLLREQNLWKVDPEVQIERELVSLGSAKPRRPAQATQTAPATAPATSTAPANQPSPVPKPAK